MGFLIIWINGVPAVGSPPVLVGHIDQRVPLGFTSPFQCLLYYCVSSVKAFKQSAIGVIETCLDFAIAVCIAPEDIPFLHEDIRRVVFSRRIGLKEGLGEKRLFIEGPAGGSGKMGRIAHGDDTARRVVSADSVYYRF